MSRSAADACLHRGRLSFALTLTPAAMTRIGTLCPPSATGFFDEVHTIDQLVARGEAENGDLEAHTRLRFFRHRWEPHSPVSQVCTGTAFHAWRVHEVDDRWRIAAQMVERFGDLNDNAHRLFATPDDGLNN